MANKRISELTAVSSINRTEELEVNQGGVSKKATAAQILDAATKDDVGLSNVDNTSDADKPVSTAQQAAITAAIEGLKWKASVSVATTANITLSGEQTIDGVLTSASRILVKNQTDQTQNGIYVTAAGVWARSADANSAAELEGATVPVQQGTSNSNTSWTQVTDNITLGSSNIVFTQLGGSQPDASETTKGIAEIATQVETHTGSDDSRFVTPLKLATEKDATGGIVGLTLFKINFKNALNTFTSFFTNSNTAARTYTFQDRDGTIADDTDLASKANLAGSKVIQVAASDETTAITASNGKISFRMPYSMTLTAIRASLVTAQSSGSIFTVDVNENGTTILSTKITIDNTEKTSTTAAAQPVISDATLSDDSEITIDVDQIGDGTAKGLKITLIGS